MGKDEEIAKIKKHFGTNELRGKSPLEKAVYLVSIKAGHLTHIAAACDISHQSLYRALKAKMQGRQLGNHGRPSLFTEEDESEFIDHLKSLAASNALTYAFIRDQVREIIKYLSF
jgi:DNA-binding phage protein